MSMDRLSLEQLRLLREGLEQRARVAKSGMLMSGDCVDCFEKLSQAVTVLNGVIEREK